jgi:hypothetical protein
MLHGWTALGILDIMSDMPACFRLVLHPNPGTLKTDKPGATGIGRTEQNFLHYLVPAPHHPVEVIRRNKYTFMY